MTGSELLVGAAAKGVAALITDTTKTGVGARWGRRSSAVSSKSKQAFLRPHANILKTIESGTAS